MMTIIFLYYREAKDFLVEKSSGVLNLAKSTALGSTDKYLESGIFLQ